MMLVDDIIYLKISPEHAERPFHSRFSMMTLILARCQARENSRTTPKENKDRIMFLTISLRKEGSRDWERYLFSSEGKNIWQLSSFKAVFKAVLKEGVKTSRKIGNKNLESRTIIVIEDITGEKVKIFRTPAFVQFIRF